MNPHIAEGRPPFVRFELRSVEDREASIKSGHYVGKDVAFALVTPMGSKDCVERVADEWFQHITTESANGRFPATWLEAFKHSYKSWASGQDCSLVSGSPLRSWPPISPSQLQTALSLGLRSVEDLANCTEECISRLGMGGRALKDRAIFWLREADGIGKQSEKLAALEVQNAQLQATVLEMSAQLQRLSQSTLPAVERGTESLGLDDDEPLVTKSK